MDSTLITYVIPCSGSKAMTAGRARDFYTGTMFQHTLRCAEANAAKDEAAGRPTRILILSAAHGLIALGDEVAPYDVKMGAKGSVPVEVLTAQAEALGIDWESDVYALLPHAYFARLDDALRALDCYAHDVYEGNEGIGDQRFINACIAR